MGKNVTGRCVFSSKFVLIPYSMISRGSYGQKDVFSAMSLDIGDWTINWTR